MLSLNIQLWHSMMNRKRDQQQQSLHRRFAAGSLCPLLWLLSGFEVGALRLDSSALTTQIYPVSNPQQSIRADVAAAYMMLLSEDNTLGVLKAVWTGLVLGRCRLLTTFHGVDTAAGAGGVLIPVGQLLSGQVLTGNIQTGAPGTER